MTQQEREALQNEWLVQALGQYGYGETTGNNQGEDIDKYRFGQTYGAWCAWFLSWCLQEACDKLGLPMPFRRQARAKGLYAAVKKFGQALEEPRVGALGCLHVGAQDSPRGHVFLVLAVNPETGKYWFIDGNRGAFPSLVSFGTRRRGEPGLLGFAALTRDE